MVLPLNTPALIEGTRVTLVEANHCPGAAMVVAEPPNRPTVLHTGDARYEKMGWVQRCISSDIV